MAFDPRDEFSLIVLMDGTSPAGLNQTWPLSEALKTLIRACVLGPAGAYGQNEQMILAAAIDRLATTRPLDPAALRNFGRRLNERHITAGLEISPLLGEIGHAAGWMYNLRQLALDESERLIRGLNFTLPMAHANVMYEPDHMQLVRAVELYRLVRDQPMTTTSAARGALTEIIRHLARAYPVIEGHERSRALAATSRPAPTTDTEYWRLAIMEIADATTSILGA